MPNFSRRLILTTFGIMCYGVSIGISMSMFNNFLNDTYHLSAQARGNLEFPRELPGFLTVAVAGSLFFLTDKWKAALAAVIAAAGQILTANSGDSFTLMVFFLMLWSIGDHLYFPMKAALILDCAKEHNRGRLLGSVGSMEVVGIIAGGLLSRFLAGYTVHYFPYFAISSVTTLLAGIVFTLLPRSEQKTGKKMQLLFRKEYRLYYILEMLYGARKQIFLTFGPWVLIKTFNQGVETFAILTVLGHALAFFTRPSAGWLIDKLGERFVLMMDGSLLILVCLGYAFANHLPIAALCLPFALLCYLLDQTLFYIDIARVSYLSKTVIQKSDLSPSLTAGVSVNHIASMTIPFFAGHLWSTLGPEFLFAAAAVFAISIVFAASKVHIRQQSV